MSRSKKGSKGPGYEYWGRRPESCNHGAVPGPYTKRLTHRAERREGKKEVDNETLHHSHEYEMEICPGCVKCMCIKCGGMVATNLGDLTEGVKPIYRCIKCGYVPPEANT